MEEKHVGFSSRIGFVLAAAGSAVGLGNIWRFPYLAAKYGGGIFLLTYLVVIITFGYGMMLSENAIGRMTGKGPVGSYRHFCSKEHSFLKFIGIGGWINSMAPIIILPYYCVIGGWVTKYLCMMFYTPISQFTSQTSGAYFNNFIASPVESTIYFILFGMLMVGVVALGVEKGIERFNKMLMPALVILCIALCIYSCFLPNAGVGLSYYLKPNWSDFSYMTVVAAIGQAFFSLSLAMGIAITYGSYMRKQDNLISSVHQVECFDTGVAFLAGMMIIPAVVAFGGIETAKEAGPGLVFVTLPQVFASFKGGQFVGILFFTLVLFAAATSAISLLETNVQTICQELKLSRKNSITIASVWSLVIGVLTVLGYSTLKSVHPLAFLPSCEDKDILDSLDFLSNNLIMPLGAIFTTLLVCNVIGMRNICKEIKGDFSWRRQFLYELSVCVLCIPCLLIVLLNVLGIIS